MDQDYFMDAGVVSPQSQWSGEQAFIEQQSHFDSSLSSMVSGPPAANDAFVLREMIMKLGGGAVAFPGSATAATLFSGGANNSTNFAPPLPSVSADPAFAERAAKFSCYGSRSFNGRTENNIESAQQRSPAPLMGNVKISRDCSGPSLRQGGLTPENKNFTKIQTKFRSGNGISSGSETKASKIQAPGDNSNDESSVSDQMPSSNELNSRKRKAKGNDDANAKRLKASESVKNETRAEEEEEANEKQKTNQKPPELPKDYIHVRARRGQATDSHSLAERVRREKISERMKLLQDLVPGCNKVTGKALMLDEIINYVQSLQRQVEFLSMKLATVNPGLDFNIVPKEIPQQMYPLNSSFFHQDVQQLHETWGPLSQCSMAPLQLDTNLGIHLPSIDGFTHNLPQLPAFNEDDLHSIVQMGFAQNPSTFPSTSHSTDMEDER